MKKREQFQEEKRIHRAQEMEKMNSKVWPQGGTPNQAWMYSSDVDFIQHSVVGFIFRF